MSFQKEVLAGGEYAPLYEKMLVEAAGDKAKDKVVG